MILSGSVTNTNFQNALNGTEDVIIDGIVTITGAGDITLNRTGLNILGQNNGTIKKNSGRFIITNFLSVRNLTIGRSPYSTDLWAANNRKSGQIFFGKNDIAGAIIENVVFTNDISFFSYSKTAGITLRNVRFGGGNGGGEVFPPTPADGAPYGLGTYSNYFTLYDSVWDNVQVDADMMWFWGSNNRFYDLDVLTYHTMWRYFSGIGGDPLPKCSATNNIFYRPRIGSLWAESFNFESTNGGGIADPYQIIAKSGNTVTIAGVQGADWAANNRYAVFNRTGHYFKITGVDSTSGNTVLTLANGLKYDFDMSDLNVGDMMIQMSGVFENTLIQPYLNLTFNRPEHTGILWYGCACGNDVVDGFAEGSTGTAYVDAVTVHGLFSGVNQHNRWINCESTIPPHMGLDRYGTSLEVKTGSFEVTGGDYTYMYKSSSYGYGFMNTHAEVINCTVIGDLMVLDAKDVGLSGNTYSDIQSLYVTPIDDWGLQMDANYTAGEASFVSYQDPYEPTELGNTYPDIAAAIDLNVTDVTVTTDTLTFTGTVLSPTVSGDSNVSPSPIPAAFTVEIPNVSGSANISPEALGLVAQVLDPTVTTETSIIFDIAAAINGEPINYPVIVIVDGKEAMHLGGGYYETL